MPPPDQMDENDLVDQIREQEEPPDGWQPATPQDDAGYGVEALPGIDPIPANQRYEAGYRVDVVPQDLAHFSQMLGLDTQAFNQSHADALNQLAQGYPNFSGVRITGEIIDLEGEDREAALDDLGGTYLPEGWSFQQTYLRSYGMLQQLLGESMAGLLYLTAGAATIDLQYQIADVFSPGGRGSGFHGESGYDVALVNSVFNPDDQQLQERDEGISEQAQEEWLDTLAEERENGDDAPAADSAPILIGDTDPRDTETRHEGQPGEYTAPRDQQNVEWFDEADDYSIDAPTEGDVDPDDITVFHPETRERWHNV